MGIERVTLCLNTDDPDQKELHEYLTLLPNGKKRNSSAFLKTMSDREYQKQRERYLAERRKFEEEKKTQKAPEENYIKVVNGEIRYGAKR